MSRKHRSPRRRRLTLRLLLALRGIAVGSSELLLALALVAVLATLLTFVLVLSFPQGSGLQNLYDEWADDRAPASDLRYRGLTDKDGAFVAVLSGVQRRVRDRPATALSWKPAHAGKKLRDEHTIQTYSRSGASIDFGDRGRLELGERSLVVVKQPDVQEGLDRKHASIVLLGGRVRGEVGDGPGRSPKIEIVTPGGSSSIRAARGETTGFNVTLHPDESSTVSIYDGTVEIATPDGARRVGPYEALTYDATGILGPVVPVPDPPRIDSPRPGMRTVFGSEIPRVRFSWSAAPDVTSHHLRLARDPQLTDVVYSGDVANDEFVHGDLSPGDYYWTVSSISRMAESKPTEVHHFQLVQDLAPPALAVELPPEVEGRAELLLRGFTEPGARVYVANRPVDAAPDGSFEMSLTLQRGLNMVVVEAIDEAGNTTYESRYVTARY
jgi:Glucodextranase, domain B/FecR protein